MTNINKKFKERDPLKTIEFIQQFFTSRGYTIKIVDQSQSEAGTFSCGLMLYKGNYFILRACGKGMTNEYSLASGHAELYERFCNRCNFVRHPFFMDARSKLMYEKYGYYTKEGEKVLNYDDIMQYPMYDIFYKRLLRSRKNIEAYWKIINCNNIIGEPFYDLTNNNNIVYHNQQIANRITCSVGMSAGNTIEEALNQGISEICEHMVTDKFYVDKQETYYVIDPTTLNAELQEKLQNIEKAGLKMMIFDLSYNFNMPVVMSLLINPFTQITTVNFGSFPIFDIAAERVITEIYQNIESYVTGNKIMLDNQLPFLAQEESLFNRRKNSACDLHVFDESLILNKIQLVSYNKNVFFDKDNTSNEQLNQYFIKLFKEHNYSIHYIDNSLMPEVKAVYIIIPEYNYIYKDYEHCKNYSDNQIHNNLITIMKRHKLANEILFNPDLTPEEGLNRYLDIQNQEQNNPQYDGYWDGTLTFVDWTNPIPTVDGFLMRLNIQNLEFNKPFHWLYGSILFAKLKTYSTIRDYVASQVYSHEDILNIMNKIFDAKCSLKDIQNCFNTEFIFEKTIMNPIREYYNSQDYKELIESTM